MPAIPYLIQFDQFGNSADGYITTTQYANNIPFEMKRIFWAHSTPVAAKRGNHANLKTEEVLIAISGVIQVQAETVSGKYSFELFSPQQGLYIPALCWTELTFSEHTISLCLASTDFDDTDYIRDHEAFKKLLISSV